MELKKGIGQSHRGQFYQWPQLCLPFTSSCGAAEMREECVMCIPKAAGEIQWKEAAGVMGASAIYSKWVKWKQRVALIATEMLE